MSFPTSQVEADHLETMARSIGHELRTPLSAIKSGVHGVKDYVPMLVETYRTAIKHGLNVPEIQPKHLDMLSKALELAERAAFCASSYVNMFVTNISKVDVDKLALNVLSMKACLQEAVEQYPNKTDEQKSILLNAVYDVDEFSLLGNKALIVNLLLNLFKNSIYHIQDSGKGEIKVWSKQSIDKNYLYIRDTASGIAENELAHIFDPFYCAQKHSIGMGLYFCKNLMKALDGDITCDSKKECYTEFVISFPTIPIINIKASS